MDQNAHRPVGNPLSTQLIKIFSSAIIQIKAVDENKTLDGSTSNRQKRSHSSQLDLFLINQNLQLKTQQANAGSSAVKYQLIDPWLVMSWPLGNCPEHSCPNHLFEIQGGRLKNLTNNWISCYLKIWCFSELKFKLREWHSTVNSNLVSPPAAPG